MASLQIICPRNLFWPCSPLHYCIYFYTILLYLLLHYFELDIFVLQSQEDVILKLDNSAQIFNTLSDIPGDVTDAEELLEVDTLFVYTCNVLSFVLFPEKQNFARTKCLCFQIYYWPTLLTLLIVQNSFAISTPT